jgi:acyl-CoA thioesterase FadM
VPEYTYTILPEYVGGFGRVTASSLVRIFQRAATRHSDDLGYTSNWYQNEGVAWMARKHRLKRTNPIPLEKPITVRTQVEDFRRVRSLRSYELRDSTGETIVRGFTDWIYVDRNNGRPCRIPDELAKAFEPQFDGDSGKRTDRDSPDSISEEPTFRTRVRFDDLDEIAHLNNAVYVDYLFEGLLQNLCKNRESVPLSDNADPIILSELSIKYLNQSRWKDTIRVYLRPTDPKEGEDRFEFILKSEDRRVTEGTCTLLD